MGKYIKEPLHFISAMPSGTMRMLQILRDGLDSRLETIALNLAAQMAQW